MYQGAPFGSVTSPLDGEYNQGQYSRHFCKIKRKKREIVYIFVIIESRDNTRKKNDLTSCILDSL